MVKPTFIQFCLMTSPVSKSFRSLSEKANCFIPFKESIAAYPLPERFTFPFYYDPHPLCLIAAKSLQQYLLTQTDWEHNFGIDPNKKGLVIGKMFGVLVVKNAQGEIGYLVAFSGKLAGENHHPYFVPPVFDMLKKDGFFRQEEEVLNGLNRAIEILEANPALAASQNFLEEEKERSVWELAERKKKIKADKKIRKLCRQHLQEQGATIEQMEVLEEELKNESLRAHFYYKDFSKYWKHRLHLAEQKRDVWLNKVALLKKERKEKSGALQQKLFDQYSFLNQAGEEKSVGAIFRNTIQKIPPAGAGECAAPKLLQYAFLNQMKPLAMAEFWWGTPPKSAVRKQGQFYPACRGKCEPILAHMLEGIEMDENPMLVNPAIGKSIDIVFEDEALLVIQKPAEFLSVPGKNIRDSVFQRIQDRFPDASGPLIVHRLDMSTSGLMLIAKSKETHKFLQHQFIKRSIKKRYVALLDGEIREDEGTIDLPLRVDLDDRPRQLVCYEHGKSARTHWKVIDRKNQQTRVHFFPITGRTHQLRVHAAHPLGLNTAIIGDDLYGRKMDRLHLHAEFIEFTHPVSREVMQFEVAPEF